MKADGWASRWARSAVWLSALIFVGIAALSWAGYRAAREWQLSSVQLVDRRVREMASVLVRALGRDMQGVQASTLAAQQWSVSSFGPPYEINDTIASEFARHPYPELFFGWRAGTTPAIMFFGRTDRRPPWLQSDARARRYPVELGSSDTVSAMLIDRIGRDIRAGRRYSTFEVTIEGLPYQVIARPLYRDGSRTEMTSVFGFMVNLDWARQSYFTALADEVSRIADDGGGLEYQIVDDAGRSLRASDTAPAREAWAAVTFPVLFFDPNLVKLDAPLDLPQRIWRIEVNGAREPTLALATTGARLTMLVIGAAAILMGAGLVVAMRAVRASADLATMRSEFVSTVTHELKTPLATIRAIGQTLVRGRVRTPEDIQTYAGMLVREESRLARLVDNLLAYARITEATDVYSFEALEPATIAAEALRGLPGQFGDANYQMDVDVPESLPPIRADRTAMVLALGNLLDNAFRYSGTSLRVALEARHAGHEVVFTVTDAGIGIPADEINRVQRRFARARNANGRGSGLGLAIVSRVVADHRGRLQITSTVNVGTRVTMAIPAAERERHDETDSDRRG